MHNFDLELITDNLIALDRKYVWEALSKLRNRYSEEEYKKIHERLKEKLGV